jgi:hypothetical protein
MKKPIQKTLPGMSMKVKWYNLHLFKDADGLLVMHMMRMKFPLDNERFYTTAPTHRRFVSDGIIVYVTAEWVVKMTDAAILEHLAEWKKGNWTTIDLRSPKKRKELDGK